MKLLFLNSLKGLKKKKVQMLGIVLMVFLSTAIYTMMSGALDRLENRYYTYIEEQNIEDFSFAGVIDYKKDYNQTEIDSLLNTKFISASEDEIKMINNYKLCLISPVLDECLNENMYKIIENIFNKYNANENKLNEKLSIIAKKNNFSYELEQTKVVNEDKYLFKLIPYNKDKKINIPYLIEGNFPTLDNEVTVLERFAIRNDLKVGDKIDLGGNKYKISGIVYASDYIYPIISINTPLFDETHHTIVFTNQNTFDSIQGLKEDVFSAKFNYKTDPRNKIKFEYDQEKQQVVGPLSSMFEKEKESITMNMSTMIRNIRVDALQLEFSSNRLFAEYFLYLLLGISVFIIVIVMKKRIDDERLQIGVLKSLGYKSTSIATSYLVYPIVGSVIGGLLGSVFGTFISKFLTKFYVSFYTLPIDNLSFNGNYILASILVPLVVLTILSYLIAVYMLRHKPIELLKEGSNLSVNWFNKLVVKLTNKLSFKTRFKYSLAARSLGKLVIVSLTSFFTGMLIVLTLIGMNLFSSMINDTFDSLNYKYMVSYLMPQSATELNNKEDYITGMSLNTNKVIVNKETKTIEKEESITIEGISKGVNLISVVDENEKDLVNKLDDDSIIINKNTAGVLNVSVGDKIIFTYNNKEIVYEIVGISNSFMGMSSYVDRGSLNTLIGLPTNSYNKKYSDLDKYSSMKNLDANELMNISGVFSIDDLEKNMETTMETANASIYVVIAFAAVMALIIIGVIANIVVEENKKNISLMKVMGYDNKKISSIILNIYTPFVIIAYLLSIPCMISLLKTIVKVLTNDVSMSIPITLDPIMALLGLVGLLVSYYIAINLSRSVLNKVPLAIALKRE